MGNRSLSKQEWQTLRRRRKRYYLSATKNIHAEAQAARRRQQRRRKTVHRVAGGCLMGLAGVVAVTHMAEHLGFLHVMSPGLQDLFIGYPTAGVLLLVAVIVLGS